MSKEELYESYFTEKDIPGMSHDEFQLAMIGLIEKGLMEVKEVDGVKMYRPTQILLKMKTHFSSNIKTQN